MVPKLLVYALSFTFLATYRKDHHHLMHVVERIDGRPRFPANMDRSSPSAMPAATALVG